MLALLSFVYPLTHSFSYSHHLWCLSDQTSKHIHTYIYIHTPYIQVHVPCCPRAFPTLLKGPLLLFLFFSPPAVVLSCLFLFPIHSLVRFFLLPFLPSFCPLRLLPLPSHLHFSCFCLLEPSQLGVALSFALRQGPFFFSALPQARLPPFYPLAKSNTIRYYTRELKRSLVPLIFLASFASGTTTQLIFGLIGLRYD